MRVARDLTCREFEILVARWNSGLDLSEPERDDSNGQELKERDRMPCRAMTNSRR